MNHATLTGALLAVTLYLPLAAGPASAQSSADQKCINNMNKAGLTVSKAQGKENTTCIKNAAKGSEANPASCVTADARGKVQGKKDKTTAVDGKDCTDAPAFGYAGAAAVNTAASGEGASLASDVFGAGMDATLAASIGNSDDGNCQWKVHKQIEKVMATTLKEFRSCKKQGLKGGSITDASGLESCLSQAAASSKAAKAADKLDREFTKRCVNLSPDTLLAGDCSASGDFAGCLAALAQCRGCRLVNAIDIVSVDCDLLDDGAINSSCPADPPATTTTTSTTTTTTTTVPTVACGASNFLDVTGAAGPGVNDPVTGQPLVPQLSASCNGTTMTVTSNNIPHYTFTQLTPTDLDDVAKTFLIPQTPALAANWTAISCLGTVGVAVNGVQWFGPNEAQVPDPYGDPVGNGITDECRGHHGNHHYHGFVTKCLTQDAVGTAEPWNLPDLPTDEPSPIVAYAYDGFPIYGSFGCEDAGCTTVIEYKSSWESTAAANVGCASSAVCSGSDVCIETVVSGVETTACVPSTYSWDNHTYVSKPGSEYLDVCNGHTDANGDYHYHRTNTFPYILGCFSGTPSGGAGNGTGPGIPSPCPTP